MRSRSLAQSLVRLLALAPLLSACSSDKNHVERAAAVPPSSASVEGCVGSCAPDPGSMKPINCAAALAGLQFVGVTGFEPVAPSTVIGSAPALYTYGDATPGSFLLPVSDITRYNAQASLLDPNAPLATLPPEGWGTPAVGPGAPCGSLTGSLESVSSLRVYGGKFASYGGGFGRGLPLCDPLTHPGLCPDPAKPRADLATTAYWNLSGWDGLAFWARRGPDSQSALNLSLLEANTSDGLAGDFPGGAHCKVLPRSCACAAGQSCLATPEPTSTNGVLTYAVDAPTHLRCRQPDAPLPTTDSELGALCGEDACGDANKDDKLYSEGAPPVRPTCRAYSFADGKSGSYCFNTDDPNPPEARARCGNGWATAVTLTGNWQLFFVPFAELRQSTSGMQAVDFDASAIASISFGFAAGWIDVYVDELAFYRSAR